MAVQVPRDSMPTALDDVDATWTRLELWLNETLGWTGLGHCSSMDLSGPLTAFGETVDVNAALAVLSDNLGISGLPDARHRVAAAGGTMSVISNRGSGTTIDVRLPVAA